MEIRPALSGDYEGYCALAAELDSLHAKKADRYYRLAGEPARGRAFFDALLADRDKALFVAEAASGLAGYIHLEARTEADVPVLVPMRWANVHDAVVASPFRRQGLGRLLVARARAWARLKGCRDLRLSVFDFNTTAMAFYFGEGFTMRNHIMALPLD